MEPNQGQYPSQPGQYPPYVAAPPPVPTLTPKKTSPAGRIIAGVAVVVVILGLVAAAGLHARSAPGVLKSFYDDFFSYKYDAAFALICPSKQSGVKPTFDTLKTELQAIQSQVTFDTSKLQYDVQNSGLTSADIHVHGQVTATATGGTTSPPTPFDEVDSMALNGLSWCVNIDKFATGSSS